MRFNEWKAVDGGDCPKVFGYTANTRWYTAGSNRYIFSNDESDFKIGTISFWHGEEYVSRPGCTVDDEAGEQVNRDLLYNEIKKEIDAFQCPANISDMYELSNDLTSYYDTLRNDENNKYRVLWSHDLAEEVIRIIGFEDFNETVPESTLDGLYTREDIKFESTFLGNIERFAKKHSIEIPDNFYDIGGAYYSKRNILMGYSCEVCKVLRLRFWA